MQIEQIMSLFKSFQHNTRLKELWFLGEIQYNDEQEFLVLVGQTLKEFLQQNNSVKHLSLSGNNLGDTIATDLAVGLSTNDSLIYLTITHNDLGDEGVIAIANALRYRTKSLISLDLSNNHISDKGVAKLIDVIRFKKELTHLYLNHNQIGDDGAQSIGTFLSHAKSITRLCLQNNSITGLGFQYLATALMYNQSLTFLNVSYNDVNTEYVKIPFIRVLKYNTKLRDLRIECHRFITSKTAEEIQKEFDLMLEYNDTIRTINCIKTQDQRNMLEQNAITARVAPKKFIHRRDIVDWLNENLTTGSNRSIRSKKRK